MRDHGRKVLLVPPLYSTIKLAREFSRQLRGYIQTQFVETEAELLRATERLNDLQGRAADLLAAKRAEIEKGQERLLELDRRGTGGEEERNQILHRLGASEAQDPSLWQLRASVSQIRTDVSSTVLEKIGDFLKAGSSSHDVRDYFQSLAAGSAFAVEVSRAYENLQKSGYDSRAAAEGIEDNWPEPTEAQRKRAKSMQHSLASLFLALRRVMTEKAEQYLRLLGGRLATEVNELSRRQAVSIWSEVNAELLTELDRSSDGKTGALLRELLTGFTFSPVDFGEAQVLALPEDVLRIPEPVIADTKSENYTYTTHEDPAASCFKGAEIIHQGTRDLLQLRMPAADQMEATLLKGIDDAQNALWKRYFEWFEACFNKALEVIQSDFDLYLNLIKEGLARRRGEMQKDATVRKELWNGIDAKLRDVDERVAVLARDADLKTGS